MKATDGTLDLEIEISTGLAVSNFSPIIEADKNCSVVHCTAFQPLPPPFAVGDLVRIVAGRETQKGKKV